LKILLGLCSVLSLWTSCALADGMPFRLLELSGHRVKWGNVEMGSGATVTFAIVTKPRETPNARNCDVIQGVEPLIQAANVTPIEFRRELSEAFAMWSSVANISFKETTDENAAGILIGAQAIPEGRAFANVAEVQTDNGIRRIDKALVCLNPRAKWKVGFDGDLDIYDLRYTLAHEIGHAIGLDHPAPAGRIMGFKYTEKFRTLQPGDAAGAIALYGKKPLVTQAENTVEDGMRPSKPMAVVNTHQLGELSR
jgi:Matrixin